MSAMSSTNSAPRSSGQEGLGKSRIETLTDGVFAIAMTLLVLEISVPEISHSSGTEDIVTELSRKLFELWPKVLSYVISFVILGIYWIGHHNQFHYIKRSDRILLWITILFLMFVAFIPFSTALLREYGDQQISVIIYGINLILTGLSLYLQWWYAATKDRRLVESDLDAYMIKMAGRRVIIGTLVYLISIASLL